MEYMYEVVYVYDNDYHPLVFFTIMFIIIGGSLNTRRSFNKRRDNSVIPTIRLSDFWRIVLFSPGSLYIPPDETEELLSVYALSHIVMQVGALLLIIQGVVTIILYYIMGLQEHLFTIFVISFSSLVMLNFIPMFVSRLLDRKNSKGIHYNQ